VEFGPVRLPVSAAGDRAGVQLRSEPEPSRLVAAVDRGSGVSDLASSSTNEVGQRVGVDLDGRGGVGVEVGGWAVEADEGVEVDDAASLVLGHLGELDPDQLTGCGFGETEMAGQLPP
jgi:hypothetical protein